MVQSMLRWICDVPPRYVIPAALELYVINAIRDELLTSSPGEQRRGRRSKGRSAGSVNSMTSTTTSSSLSNNLFIVPDYSNMEMVATGFVLMKLLTPHFAHDASMVPRVLPQGEALPS